MRRPPSRPAAAATPPCRRAKPAPCGSSTTTAAAGPTAHLLPLPLHASWLDQAEIYFSVVQRKALTPNDFTSLDQIRDRLAGFETRYNAIARPFNWKFTRNDLVDLLHRIDAHDKTQPHALAA